MATALRPEKKSRARKRHELISTKYKEWLEKNPNATHAEMFRQFDLYCDSALLDEKLKNG